MTSIKGFIQLIEEEGESKYSPIILDELEDIESIMDEFLLLAKPSGETAFTPTSVFFLINRTVSMLEEETMLTGISVQKELANEDLQVICVSKQIKRVLINLMKNAIEAMPSGGNLRISYMKESENSLKISIIDNGIGMSPERISKIRRTVLFK